MEKYRPTVIGEEGVNQAQFDQFNYQIALLSKSKIKIAAAKNIFNRWKGTDGKPFSYVLNPLSVEGDSNQIEQPLTWGGGYGAACNRFQVACQRNPELTKESDLILIIENYMNLDGRDYACLILYDCHQQVEYHWNEFCAQAQDMDLLKQVLEQYTHGLGSPVTYGSLLHKKDPQIPANDWMSVVTGKKRQVALEEGLVGLSRLFLADQQVIEEIEGKFTLYPDFPKKGVMFKDWSDLFLDWKTVDRMANLVARPFQNPDSLFTNDQLPEIDYVLGLESRGIWLAGPVAKALKCGMVPIRKPGKIPGAVHRVSYKKEYGDDSLEIRGDLPKGKNVLICDDVLATGGSLEAAIKLAKAAGFNVVGCVLVTDVPELREMAATKFKNQWVRVLIQEGLRGDLIKAIEKIKQNKL